MKKKSKLLRMKKRGDFSANYWHQTPKEKKVYRAFEENAFSLAFALKVTFSVMRMFIPNIFNRIKIQKKLIFLNLSFK